MNFVHIDVRGVEWTGGGLALRARATTRDWDDGRTIDAFLRRRGSRTERSRVRCEIEVVAEAADTHDLDLALTFPVAPLTAGVWDAFVEVPLPDGEPRLVHRVTTSRSATEYPSFSWLADGCLVGKPYDTADRELSLRVSDGAHAVVTLRRVDWEGKACVLQATVDPALDRVDGFRALCLDSLAPLATSFAERGDGLVAGRVDLTGFATAGPVRLEWRVAIDGRSRWVPAGVAEDNPRPFRDWAFPAHGGLGPDEDRWMVPRLDSTRALRLCGFEPVLAHLTHLKVRRVPAVRARATLHLDACPPRMPSAEASALSALGRLALVLVPRDDFRGEARQLASVEPRGEQRVQLPFEAALRGDPDADVVLALEYEVAGRRRRVAVPVQSRRAAERYPSFQARALPSAAHPGRWQSLHIDGRSRRLRFQRRRRVSAEKAVTRAKDGLAAVAARVANRLDPRETWLVGENFANIAQDNGAAFFEHCVAEQKPERVFYVARTSNKHQSRLGKNRAHVLRHNSFRHYVNYHRASRLVVAHGIRDVMPSLHYRAVGENRKSVCYLQHGIIAMKRVNYRDNSYNGMIDAFVVSSEFERELMARYNRLSRRRMIVTGLPRYDSLVAEPRERFALVMPTWRDWTVKGRAQFEASEFLHVYRGLLTDPELLAALEEHDFRIRFFPHIQIENGYLDLLDFVGGRVELCSYEDADIQSEIRRCAGLLTDYSSVAWDVNYLEKPVVFFQFDRREFEAKRGMYIDPERDLPGYVITDADAARAALLRLVRGQLPYRDRDREMSDCFYGFRDQNNAERVYRAIRRLPRRPA